ncbi:MAG TPA: DUF4418 family protein [Anaerolineaceae bacterium]|nr:DUF4418 family protein [Anaerolineaceae bacterium]
MALFLIIFPQFFDCESQGRALELANGKTVPMKCHWSALAEIAVGVPLLSSGIMLLLTKQRSVKISMGVIGIVLGVMAAIIPAYLIGVCGMATMICRMVMLPAILLASGLVVLASVVIVILAASHKDQVNLA